MFLDFPPPDSILLRNLSILQWMNFGVSDLLPGVTNGALIVHHVRSAVLMWTRLLKNCGKYGSG